MATKKRAARRPTKKKATRGRAIKKSPAEKKKGSGRGGARPGAGRPPFEPTPQDRSNVETLAGLGLRHEEICMLVRNPTTGQPIDAKTLRAHFRSELDRGAPLANANVAKSLYSKAMGDGPQCVTAAIWWTKCRMGWREQVLVSAEVRSGVLVSPGQVDPDAWIAAAAARTRDADEPGSGGRGES